MEENNNIPHQCSTCIFWVEAWRIERSTCWVDWTSKRTQPNDSCEKWTDMYTEKILELL